MRPDRVVGLSMNDRYREYIEACPNSLTHSPFKKMQLLYPFLVVEAKRENDVAGFRSIEAQTAFPIRRFLKMQDDLRKAREMSHDPLVWFFAYQGENWQFYAGTLQGDKVVRFDVTQQSEMRLTKTPQRVYDLWHGTIESHHGALQIFQIIDFIWTWARDVYRPQIRRCLRGHNLDVREISPTSTLPPRRSESVFPLPSVRSIAQSLPESVQEGEVTALHEADIDRLAIADASSSPFLRWADNREISAPRARQCSIRHSDIIMFSFRILMEPENELEYKAFNAMLNRDRVRSAQVSQRRVVFTISKGDLQRIEECWTGVSTSASTSLSTVDPDEIVRAVFFFRTLFEQENWQLRREIYCVILPTKCRALILLEVPETQQERAIKIFTVFRRLRSYYGRTSVVAASRSATGVIVVLANHTGRDRLVLQWLLPQHYLAPSVSPMGVHQVSDWFRFASCSESARGLQHYQSARLLRLLPVLRTEHNTDIPAHDSRSSDSSETGAILLVKPESWPSQCPRFCLFVLQSQGFDDKEQLGRLLRYTIDAEEIHNIPAVIDQGKPPLSTEDNDIITSWLNHFE